MIEHKSNYSFIAVLLLAALVIAAPLHAGLLRDVLTQTDILTVASPMTTAVGIELDDTVTALDGGISSFSDGGGAEPIMSVQQTRNLLTMDTPASPMVSNIEAVAFAQEPADDQPALIPLVNLDPIFLAGQIQTILYRCVDSDGDGVCDQDDQCLKTPAGIKVLGNGCYLDGPRGLVLEDVYFANDSHQLSMVAQQVLQNVAEVIRQSSANLIEVGGFTDNVGKTDYNLRLSAARAAAVRDYLVSLGIKQSRLQGKGYGESSPRTENNSAEGRAKNRRVELKIVEREQ